MRWYIYGRKVISSDELDSLGITSKLFALHCTNNRAFETKEEAEWCLEFGNIARVEKLSLPTFDEFKDKAGGLMFYIKTGYVLLSISDDRKMVYIQGDELIFNAPLTKENYIDACKICKRLFKGE